MELSDMRVGCSECAGIVMKLSWLVSFLRAHKVTLNNKVYMHGARMLSCSDVSDGWKLNERRKRKCYTGGWMPGGFVHVSY